MLRPEYTFTYTSAISFAETRKIDALMALAKKPEKTEDEAAAVQSLAEMLPEVVQARITVAQCNGMGDALYKRLLADAHTAFRDYINADEDDYDGDRKYTDDERDMLNLLYNACAALAATTKFERRTTKPVITAEEVTFADTEWEQVPLFDEYPTVGVWVEECPGTLQTAWANRAYDANPELWRKSTDPASKNFAAVSETGSKMR